MQLHLHFYPNSFHTNTMLFMNEQVKYGALSTLSKIIKLFHHCTEFSSSISIAQSQRIFLSHFTLFLSWHFFTNSFCGVVTANFVSVSAFYSKWYLYNLNQRGCKVCMGQGLPCRANTSFQVRLFLEVSCNQSGFLS